MLPGRMVRNATPSHLVECFHPSPGTGTSRGMGGPAHSSARNFSLPVSPPSPFPSLRLRAPSGPTLGFRPTRTVARFGCAGRRTCARSLHAPRDRPRSPVTANTGCRPRGAIRCCICPHRSMSSPMIPGSIPMHSHLLRVLTRAMKGKAVRCRSSPMRPPLRTIAPAPAPRP